MPEEIREPTLTTPSLYKGLEPFTENDADIFFARNEDRDRLVYSMQSSRLTILYGAKQVGKTSLMRAGVAHQLRKISEKQSKTTKQSVSAIPESVVVVFDDWSGPDVLEKLSIVIDEELKRVGVSDTDRPKLRNLDFITRCEAWTACLGDYEEEEKVGGELFILLDQFEDYLLQHPYANTQPGSFDIEFPRVLAKQGLAVNFLIAIREDLLASLDRYRCTIANFYGNLIRLEALNKRQVLEAIQNPIYIYYNTKHKDDKIGIEAELIKAVLVSVNLEQKVNIPDLSEYETVHDPGYDAAGLQLVMKSIWDSEILNDSKTLRHKTFVTQLGGITGITEKYVKKHISMLTTRQKHLGARVFNYLITPGGMAVAYPIGELAKEVGVTEKELKELMQKLEQEGILVMTARGRRASICYEIARMILMPVILGRVQKFFDMKAEAEQQLDSEIEKSLSLFYEKSQLDGLKMIIDAAEQWSAGKDNLLFSDDLPELQGKFRKALQKILNDLSQTAQLGGYTGAVSSIAFCRSGNTIVTGSETGSVRLWNLDSPGEEPRVYQDKHKTWIWALRASGDGKWVASGSDDGTAALWLVTDQSLEYCYSIPPPVGKSPLVRGLSFHPNEPILAIATTDGQIRLWHLNTQKVLVALKVCDQAMRCVEFSPDGLCLATGGDDKTIRLWDVKDLKVVRRKFEGLAFRHDASVWKLRFHPDGKQLASCSEDHNIKLWDIEGGHEKDTLTGHNCWVLSLRYNTKGTLLASASEDGTARLWDERGNQLASFIHGAPVNCVCFNPEDDQVLATAAADCRVRLWNVVHCCDSGHPKQFKHSPNAILMDVSFNSNGEYLASCASDNVAKIWDNDGNNKYTLAGHEGWVMCAVFHPECPHILATSSTDGTARVWNIVDGTNTEFIGHRGPVWSIAFSPNGNFLVTGSADGLIRLWKPNLNDLDKRPVEEKPVKEFSIRTPLPIWSIRFSPKGEWIAAGCQDGSVQIWNLSGEEVMRLTGEHKGAVLSLSFSPDGRFLASSSSEGQICLWKLATQKPVRFLPLDVPIWSVCFSPDGKILASGSVDRTVCFWNLDGEKLREFSAQGPIRGLSFSPDGKFLAGACSDGALWRWSTLVNEEFETLVAKAKKKWVKARPLIYPTPKSP